MGHYLAGNLGRSYRYSNFVHKGGRAAVSRFRWCLCEKRLVPVSAKGWDETREEGTRERRKGPGKNIMASASLPVRRVYHTNQMHSSDRPGRRAT
jgi:hypothetical protein